MKISDLQKWANWPAHAASKKWAENQETCRFKRNFPISKKLAELTTKKLTSGLGRGARLADWQQKVCRGRI